jgi:hypothetical protein
MARKGSTPAKNKDSSLHLPMCRYGGIPLHEARLTPVPKGLELQPNQWDCHTPPNGRVYCNLR